MVKQFFDIKRYKKSMTSELILLLGISILLSIVFFVAVYFSGKGILDFYFEDSQYLKHVEDKRASELQKYVSENSISTTDTKLLTEWIQERGIPLVTISRNRELLYDSTYTARNPIDQTDSQYLHTTWQYFHKIKFADGSADVLIYEGFEEKYYVILLVISILLSVILMLFLFMKGIQKYINYIRLLKDEIDLIGGGCLTHSIKVQGDDELASLAAGLDHMRFSLLKTHDMEEKMRVAEEELVTGMSHDLRTPLTGLMTYIEIMRKQEENGQKIEGKYLNKAFEKALQMRTLSDQLFEYFLAKRGQEIELEPPKEWNSVIGDYLSEFVYLIQNEGFLVEYKTLENMEHTVSINNDFIGRIFDNLFSNIKKYGDKNMPVVINIMLINKEIGIRIENTIGSNTQYSGSGIGINNINFMMKKMNGRFETNKTKKKYYCTIWFPIIDD